MSRERNSNDKPKKTKFTPTRSPKPSTSRAPKSASSAEDKPEKKVREPRLMSESEAKSYEKTFNKTAGKRTGKTFD